MSASELSGNFLVHKKSPHHCEDSPYSKTSHFFLANHIRRHNSTLVPFNCESSSIEDYFCKDCNHQTSLWLLFKQHLLENHHVKQENEDLCPIQTYVCEECSFETCSLIKKLRHCATCLPKRKKLQTVDVATKIKKKAFRFFYCDECEFKSKYKQCLLGHKYSKHLSDDEIAWYQCTECCFKSKRKSNLKYHMYNKHSGEGSVNKSNLARNLKPRTDVLSLGETKRKTKLFECESCSYKTEKKPNLARHVNTQHLHEKDVTWYKCEKCEFKSKDKSSLNRHVNVFHLDENHVKWYKCKSCPFKSKHASSVLTHEHINHLDEKDIRWFNCTKCPYKTKHLTNLHIHLIARHLDGNDVQCDKRKENPLESISECDLKKAASIDSLHCKNCSYKSSNSSNLREHMYLHHSPWHECEKCPFKSKKIPDLRRHVNSQHPIENDIVIWFECPKCPFKTKRQPGLQIHISTIHGDGPYIKWYECDKCSFKTKYSGSLHKHKKRHDLE